MEQKPDVEIELSSSEKLVPEKRLDLIGLSHTRTIVLQYMIVTWHFPLL